MERWSKGVFGLAMILALGMASGCGDDDDNNGGQQPTATVAPPTETSTATATAVSATATAVPATATSTPSVTPTPTMPPEEHTEVSVGSTAAGGGELKAEYEYDEPVHAHFSVCLSGSGDRCEGGIALYSVVSPGFESLEEDEPEESHFVLVDGTSVTLTLVAIDSGLSLKLGAVVADAAGESLQLGAVSFHADIEAQIVVEDGAVREDGWSATFALTASGDAYQPSEEYTLTYQLEDDE